MVLNHALQPSCRMAAAFLLACMFIVPMSSAWADPCLEARRLFNQSLEAGGDADMELSLLMRAGSICKEPDVLGPVFNNMGDVFERKGMLALAFEYYRKASLMAPGLAVPYMSAADLYRKLGDFYSARLVYRKALEAEPGNARIRTGLEEVERLLKDRVVVYFPFGGKALDMSARARLDLFIEYLRQSHGPVVIEVQGHTCDMGPRSYNNRLGLERARAVASYIRSGMDSAGIEAIRFVITSRGEDAPLIASRHPAARRLNRRVEVWHQKAR